MPATSPPPFRIGHGFDLHRLAPIAPDGPGRPFILGGVPFDVAFGPVGHSDGDALLHAITDALLGAIAAPDLGTLFRDDDPRWDGAASDAFLLEAHRRVQEAGGRIGNIDATVICERPRIGPHRAEVRGRIAEILGVDVDCVNVKGKSHEQVDAIGRGEAIAVHVVATVFMGS
ncbi:MAG: 2-C-methyl-D-erythritol 2,4-cyclodiphosphate synthase [Phycisphaerales bacterium]